jgi:murein DD-endopeptidase MepM/ murein hydrolase activator NlpD
LFLLARAEVLLADAPYRLPFPEGRSFTITQAPGGWITTHIAASNRYAVDIAMPEGTPVLAARAGVVSETEARHGANRAEDAITTGGNYVIVRHADGTFAAYAHLKHGGVEVKPGEPVAAGRLLGYSGATGYATGPHLHFGVSRWEIVEGRRTEVSVPFRFTVGAPPIVFEPRAALRVTANYSSAAEYPRIPSETRLTPWNPPPPLRPEQLPVAWLELAAWIAAALAGMAWFWRFSRS